MALDEPKDTDHTHEGDGFRIVCDKDLLNGYGGLTIEHQVGPMGAGFRITAVKESPDACGPCSC